LLQKYQSGSGRQVEELMDREAALSLFLTTKKGDTHGK
jgi:hypothetical protein